MTLIDVLDFLEEKVDCPNWYAGKRSDTAEKSITVYPTDGVAPVLPLGGVDQASYATKAVSVFVHWGKNVTAAEVKAQQITIVSLVRPGQSAEKMLSSSICGPRNRSALERTIKEFMNM